MELGLKLLKLQEEYAGRAEMIGLADEFRKPGLMPRDESAIAADYEAALRELLAD